MGKLGLNPGSGQRPRSTWMYMNYLLIAHWEGSKMLGGYRRHMYFKQNNGRNFTNYIPPV